MTRDRVYRALLALNAAEWRREMKRLRRPEKTPIETASTIATPQAMTATPPQPEPGEDRDRLGG